MENKCTTAVSSRKTNFKTQINNDYPYCSCEKKHCSSRISETKSHQAGLSLNSRSVSLPLNSDSINFPHTRTENYNRKPEYTEDEKICLLSADMGSWATADVLPSRSSTNVERRQLGLEGKILVNTGDFFARYSTIKGQHAGARKSCEAAVLHHEEPGVKEGCTMDQGKSDKNGDASKFSRSRHGLEASKEIQKQKFKSRIPKAQILSLKKPRISIEFPATIQCQKEPYNEVSHGILSEQPYRKLLKNRNECGLIPEDSASSMKWKSNPEFSFHDLYDLRQGHSTMEEILRSHIRKVWELAKHAAAESGIPEETIWIQENLLSTGNIEKNPFYRLIVNSSEIVLEPKIENLGECHLTVEETLQSHIQKVWELAKHAAAQSGIPEGPHWMQENTLSTGNIEQNPFYLLILNSPELALQPKRDTSQHGANSKEETSNVVIGHRMNNKNANPRHCEEAKNSTCKSFVDISHSLLTGDKKDISKKYSYEDAKESDDSSYKANVQRKLAELETIINELLVLTESARDEAVLARCAKRGDTGEANANRDTPTTLKKKGVSHSEREAKTLFKSGGVVSVDTGSPTTESASHPNVSFMKSQSTETTVGGLSSCTNAYAAKIPHENLQNVITNWYEKRKGKNLRSTVAVTPIRCMKKTSIDFLLTPKFIKQFRAHAMHQSGLKSGLVMTKQRSSMWMKKAGVFEGTVNEKRANQSFASDAGLKSVMNIQRYVEYLCKIALASKIQPQVLVERLSQCPPVVRKPNLETESPTYRKDISFDEGLCLLMARPMEYTCSLPSFLLN